MWCTEHRVWVLCFIEHWGSRWHWRGGNTWSVCFPLCSSGEFLAYVWIEKMLWNWENSCNSCYYWMEQNEIFLKSIWTCALNSFGKQITHRNARTCHLACIMSTIMHQWVFPNTLHSSVCYTLATAHVEFLSVPLKHISAREFIFTLCYQIILSKCLISVCLAQWEHPVRALGLGLAWWRGGHAHARGYENKSALVWCEDL